ACASVCWIPRCTDRKNQKSHALRAIWPLTRSPVHSTQARPGADRGATRSPRLTLRLPGPLSPRKVPRASTWPTYESAPRPTRRTELDSSVRWRVSYSFRHHSLYIATHIQRPDGRSALRIQTHRYGPAQATLIGIGICRVGYPLKAGHCDTTMVSGL